MKLTEERKEEILNTVREFRSDGETGNRHDFQRMHKCQNFKIGKHWDKEVTEYNKARRKHSLTINRILPTVNQLCGFEIQNRRDIKAHPVKGGTVTAANVLSALVKHAMDSSYADHRKSLMFNDGVTTAKGYLHVYKDFGANPRNAELVIDKPDPFDVIVDSGARPHYDINKSGKFVIVDEWKDKKFLELKYPEHKDELASASYSLADGGNIWGKLTTFLYPAAGIEDSYDETEGSPDASKGKYKYRRSFTYWKEYKPCIYVYRLNQSDLEPVKITDEKQMAFVRRLAEQQADLKDDFMKESLTEVLCQTITVGNVLLEHNENPLGEGIALFPVIPFYPYYDSGYAFGIVENLVGPQEELNWARSQILNIMKTLPNAGWIVNKLMGNYGKVLEEHSHEDGFILEKHKTGGFAEQIKPNMPPMGHALISEQSARDIQEIPAIPLEPPQADKKALSGRAIALKQNWAMTGTSPLFSNYDYTLVLFATLLIEVIRTGDIYSEEEIRAILDESDLIDARLIGRASELLAERGLKLPEPPADIMSALGQAKADPQALRAVSAQIQTEMETYADAQKQYQELVRMTAEQLLFDEIKSIKVGKYGIKVGQSPQSPTMRMARFAQLLEIEQLRPGQIPLKILLEATDVPNREDVIAEIERAGVAARAG